MEAVILAGGFGTRLQPVVSDVPKSMAVVNGRPFLEYLFDYLITSQIEKVVLSVGYHADCIHRHFRDSYKSLRITYAFEPEPLGTGGGIRNAFSHVKGRKAFVINGDSLFRINFDGLLAKHEDSGAVITMGLRPMAETGRFGSVEVDETGRIIGFQEKRPRGGQGLINGGVYLVNRQFIRDSRFPAKFSIEKDCFEKYYADFPFYGYPDEGYFLDIGIPADYQKAQDEFRKF